MQLYLGAQEEVEAQSAHGEELAAVRSEQVVEAEVPSLGRSWWVSQEKKVGLWD